jgi:hypothetical protein
VLRYCLQTARPATRIPTSDYKGPIDTGRDYKLQKRQMEKLISGSLYLEEDLYTYILLRLIIVVYTLFGKLVILLSSPPLSLKWLALLGVLIYSQNAT